MTITSKETQPVNIDSRTLTVTLTQRQYAALVAAVEYYADDARAAIEDKFLIEGLRERFNLTVGAWQILETAWEEAGR